MKGLHNVLNALFMAGKRKQFRENIEKLLQFNEDDALRLSVNERGQLQLFKYTHGINSIFMSAQYEYGANFVKDLVVTIDNMEHPWDPSRIMVFNYKIACIYFGNGDLDNTITFLNRVENEACLSSYMFCSLFCRISSAAAWAAPLVAVEIPLPR